MLAVLATLFYTKSKQGNELVVLQEQLKHKENQLQEQLNIHSKIQVEKEQLLAKVSRAETQYEQAQQAIIVAKQGAEKLNEQIKLEFAEIAQSIMTNQSNSLSAKSEEKLGELLKPLKTEIGEFKKKVEDTYDKESKRKI